MLNALPVVAKTCLGTPQRQGIKLNYNYTDRINLNYTGGFLVFIMNYEPSGCELDGANYELRIKNYELNLFFTGDMSKFANVLDQPFKDTKHERTERN